jgi:hypothetical protein
VVVQVVDVDVGVGLGFAVDLHGGSVSETDVVEEIEGLGLAVGLGFDVGSAEAAVGGPPVVEDAVGLGERDREPVRVPEPVDFCVHVSIFGFGIDTVTVKVPSGPKSVAAVVGVAPGLFHASGIFDPVIVIVVVGSNEERGASVPKESCEGSEELVAMVSNGVVLEAPVPGFSTHGSAVPVIVGLNVVVGVPRFSVHGSAVPVIVGLNVVVGVPRFSVHGSAVLVIVGLNAVVDGRGLLDSKVFDHESAGAVVVGANDVISDVDGRGGIPML